LDISICWRNGLEITIEDNGVGLAAPSSGGNGQGLALHSTMLAVVGGSLSVESELGRYTRVLLSLPNEAW
jgi:signal transduction histidine kinase